MEQFLELSFPNGCKAKAVRIQRSSDLSALLTQMGLAVANPTLVLVGGASGISETGLEQLRSLFTNVLAPLMQDIEAVVVDGGTDAGVMKLMGEARTTSESTFPLIGVAAIGTIQLPDQVASQQSAPLQPNHTHFALVPGAIWGDEAPWIASVATTLARRCPSLTILVNGGKIAWQDVSNSIRANRPVLVIAGSGRTADELAAALRGDRSNDRAVRMVNSGLLHVADLDAPHEELSQQIRTLFMEQQVVSG